MAVVAPLGAQAAGALAPATGSGSVAMAICDACPSLTVAASVDPVGRVGVTCQPESPSKNSSRSPAWDVVTDGDVELFVDDAASTGCDALTPENATVTIEVCPATDNVAVGATWSATATVTHTAKSVQFDTESTFVQPDGHEIVTPFPDVSTLVTSTSPAAAPAGSAVCGEDELPDANVVAPPTWTGPDDVAPPDPTVVAEGGGVVVVVVTDVEVVDDVEPVRAMVAVPPVGCVGATSARCVL